MIYIASDHAGLALKKKILEKYNGIIDLGCFSDKSTDYPLHAKNLSKKVKGIDQGILICGSGIGMCIAAKSIQAY